MGDQVRVFAFGGGVQGVACLVLSAEGKIDFRTFVFANVGQDSEDPRTLQYMIEYAWPYAAAHGIELVCPYKRRRGEQETIYQRLTRPGSRSVPVPARMSNGAPGRRSCTADFKVRVVARYVMLRCGLRFNNPEPYPVVGLGISVDEVERAQSTASPQVVKFDGKGSDFYEWLEYPLLDLRLDRRGCYRVIENAGLPVPPKSSCYFCPYHSSAEWVRLKSERPDLFARAVELERSVNVRRGVIGKDEVYFHPALLPLGEAVRQLTFDQFVPDFCGSGYCMV